MTPHMSLLKSNTTSVEVWEKHWAEVDTQKQNISGANKYNSTSCYVYPYDKGVMGNLQEVLGASMLLWLLPISPEGDGLNYPPNSCRDLLK